MKSTWSKYENRGLSGLSNMGNTCFINSCFQVLSHTYELSELIEDGTFTKRLSAHREKKYAIDCFLLLEYYKLHKIIWETNCIVAPGSFIKTIRNVAKNKNLELFMGWNQNDVSEFLLFVIDSFHNSLRREVIMNIKGVPEGEKDKMAIACYNEIKNIYSKEYSEFIPIFGGVHMSRILSKDGEVLSMKPEPFFVLDIPIPQDNKSPSLIDCMELYCEKESLDGENAWFNEKTNSKQDVDKQVVFWSLPSVMIISLKRFTADGRKIQLPIDIPLDNLDLSKFVYGYDKDSFQYELYGICNHMGGTLGGHYTAFVKNASGKWFSYNDTDVKEINIEKSLNKNYAYCLFYRKKVEV
jgi:ubiquitin C-terminal hydrolase